MPDNKKRPIIIKRVSDSGESGHHGGAWKIAYADFMTAMMAFFLVMWLINATTEEQRKGIAQFFNPMAEKDTRLGSSNGMLETSPSPLTAGTTLRKVKDGDAPDDDGGEQSGAKDAARRSEEGGSPDNITRGLKAHLTPASPAIIPVGGPESGGGKSIGTIGVDNPVAAAAEQTKIDNMVQGLEQSVAQNPDTQEAAKNMSVSFGRDDIRIELRDANNTPMFDTASATPNAAGRKMLEQIGAWLAPMPEQLSIVGYTDADQYRATKRGNGMSNWTLSAQRADGAREVLVRAGYPDRNILSVSGRADRDLALPSDPGSAANRRVVLILHRRFVNPDQAGGAIVPLPAAGGAPATQPTGAAGQPATPPAAANGAPAAPVGGQTPPAPAPAAPAPAARRTRGVRVRAATRPRAAQPEQAQPPADQPFQPSQDTWTPAPQ
ncbi:flagellar motor protein MotB [Acetobacter lambici]|uniref:OmpA family protein n=1 Tax=Acetobacter lambici TaxID=1332824 RepID=A0ABT1EXY9_9PROT|nr:flagellar motor protein MotB [Acetobacter lambici]MCP1241695.1 OmpA family protein [Acetobacter lambici]MCP1257820.1 OmpA family protein [Acetobacter lambici]